MSVSNGAHALVAALLGGLVAGWGLAGCGDSGAGIGNGNDGGPGPDTATVDASLLDAAPPDPDSAQPDAAPDGAVIDPDNDDDGYPASQDCDDNDFEVYPGVRRDCQSDCDYGTQICLSLGTWHTCTARTDCDCANPGDTRMVDCGNCGQAEQECGLDLRWEYPGTCLGEGECAPGEEYTEPCQLCGVITHTCNQECTYETVEACVSDCVPGTQDATTTGCANLGEVQVRECDASCTWANADPCSPDCRVPERVGNGDFKDDICISAGPFVMGSDQGEGELGEHPEHTVYLTPYLMDQYEVTNARYKECVDAGVCAAPDAFSTYFTIGKETLPVSRVTYDQASAFCAWDGGRTLPTEAQWEKAARGPAPSELTMPWGAAPPTCDLVIGDGCLHDGVEEPWPVDARPLGASFYGVEQMAGNVYEWCLDYLDENYYGVSPSVDPPGPTSGNYRIVRGFDFTLSLSIFDGVVTRRWGVLSYDKRTWIGFRCVRRGY